MKQNKFVKEYQCSGCVCCPADECFKEAEGKSIACDKHVAGSMTFPSIGRFFLGMPKGFDRIGEQDGLKIQIYKTQSDQEIQWKYDQFNVPVWKHQNKAGHIFIRGYIPRLNGGFIHIILKGNYKDIKAHEIDITTID